MRKEQLADSELRHAIEYLDCSCGHLKCDEKKRLAAFTANLIMIKGVLYYVRHCE